MACFLEWKAAPFGSRPWPMRFKMTNMVIAADQHCPQAIIFTHKHPWSQVLWHHWQGKISSLSLAPHFCQQAQYLQGHFAFIFTQADYYLVLTITDNFFVHIWMDWTWISFSHKASRFSTSFSDILTLSPFYNWGWPQLQFSWQIRPSHVCRFMHKAFVHGAHCVLDFSGFATGWDKGIANEKVKAEVVGVVSTVCWFHDEQWLLGSEPVNCGVGDGSRWAEIMSGWAWVDWNMPVGLSLVGCGLVWVSNAATSRLAKSIQDLDVSSVLNI